MRRFTVNRSWPLNVRIGWSIGPREPTGCRFWTAGTGPRGYAVIVHNRKQMRVSRVLLGLKPSDPRLAMHSCDNPRCVEPSHLRPGTALDNMRDSSSKGRHRNQKATHCTAGHPYDGENTMFVFRRTRPTIERRCRACNRERLASDRALAAAKEPKP